MNSNSMLQSTDGKTILSLKTTWLQMQPNEDYFKLKESKENADDSSRNTNEQKSNYE